MNSWEHWESASLPRLAIFLSRGIHRADTRLRVHRSASGSIVRGLYFRRAFLLFIDMRAGKKARQRVKNTHDGSAKSAHGTGNRARRACTL